MSNSEQARIVWIDELCDRFESSWGTEQQFAIETVLQHIADEKVEPALKALLALELDFRAKTDKPLTAAEMHQRFPQHGKIVESVLRNPVVRDAHQAETKPPRSAGAPAGLRIPKQMGRYRIIRKLGQGAMGSVFLASDEQLNRKVALKIPRGDVQRDSELRTRFEREARAVAALDHPNICRIYDIGEFEGIHYICMGYVEGFSLSRFAIAESGLSEQRIAEIVLKLAKALATAHEAGFIHRDLKPANVMIDHNDEPVILDFGIARRVDPLEETRVTQTGSNVGSPAYMSPEQLDGDQQKIGVPTDVYSLGVILYELLTGRLPFEGSMASVMGQIMTKAPDKPSVYRRDLSVRMENICLRMMDKNPEKRHPSMHAVAAALQEYLDKYAVSPAPSVPPTDTVVEDPGAKRRQQIEGLIRSADYGKAEKLLVELSRETDESLLEAASWAAAELPRLRKTREEVRAGRQDIYNTASSLMKSYDYEQARTLLEEYPYDLRTPKMQELLERAEEKTNEVARLQKRIRELRNRGENTELLASLDALLELKPNDRRARKLREQLTARSSGPVSRLLGRHKPSFIEQASSSAEWVFVVLLVAFACAYPAYQWVTWYFERSEEVTVPDDPGSSPNPVPPAKPELGEGELGKGDDAGPEPAAEPPSDTDNPHPFFVANSDFIATETKGDSTKHFSMHLGGYKENGTFDVTLFLHSICSKNVGESDGNRNEFYGAKYEGTLTCSEEGDVLITSKLTDDFQRPDGDVFQLTSKESTWKLSGTITSSFEAAGLLWTPYDRDAPITRMRERIQPDSVLLVDEFHGSALGYDARMVINEVSDRGFTGDFIYDNARDLETGDMVSERRAWVTHAVTGSFNDDGSLGLVFGKRIKKADGANAPPVTGRSDVLWIEGNTLVGANFKAFPTPLTEGSWEHIVNDEPHSTNQFQIDGTIRGTDDSSGIWHQYASNPNRVVLEWHDPNGSVWYDDVQLGIDGESYSGANQVGYRITGRRVK